MYMTCVYGVNARAEESTLKVSRLEKSAHNFNTRVRPCNISSEYIFRELHAHKHGNKLVKPIFQVLLKVCFTALMYNKTFISLQVYRTSSGV